MLLYILSSIFLGFYVEAGQINPEQCSYLQLGTIEWRYIDNTVRFNPLMGCTERVTAERIAELKNNGARSIKDKLRITQIQSYCNSKGWSCSTSDSRRSEALDELIESVSYLERLSQNTWIYGVDTSTQTRSERETTLNRLKNYELK